MTLFEAFRLLSERDPFPWQRRLLKKWSEADFSDDVLRLETGTGKTSTIAIWLAALASNPTRVPRRLVYVVNRRTVVDQTTSEVESICKRLRESELDSQLRKLSVLSLGSEEPALAVSTLRGQLADNHLWSADPARPSVIIGTVDMIGSRLLFGGYGIGWKTQPLHAGFLGQDALIIHDECHLEPAFQALLESIRDFQNDSVRPAKLVALSATPRQGQGKAFELNSEDHEYEILKDRLSASKLLSLHQVEDQKKLSEAIAKKALEHTESAKPILIFTNTVKDAQKIEKDIAKSLGKKKDIIRLLTGTIRGLERDKLINDPVFGRFLPNADSAHNDTAFLVATSAGEVGINLSSAHLICDLVPFERMAQRLGRLNRFGEFRHGTVDVFHAAELEGHLEETRRLLAELEGDASPASLSKLDAGKRDAASTPLPKIAPATDILFDALSLTTIRNLPTKPDSLESLLHGELEKEIPRTTVAWRDEVTELQGDTLEMFLPDELLESFRLKPHETLNDRTDRVLAEFRKLAKVHPDQPVWLVDSRGNIQPNKFQQILNKDTLAHHLVILPPCIGGLSATGSLDGKEPAPTDSSLDISCHYEDRLRTWETEWPGEEWCLIRRIDLSSEDTEESRVWSWYERAWGGDGKGQQTSRIVLLNDHLNAVAALARAMAKSLGFSDEICNAIEFAALWHDRGKIRRVWQTAAGNRNDPPVAKPLEKAFSGPGFRHKLASLMDIQADVEFQKLSEKQREIVQHLIAAHHGRARPFFPAKERHDPEIPSDLVGQVAKQIPHRFSDLQNHFGHWGLAYLESIIRAADYAASAGRELKPKMQ